MSIDSDEDRSATNGREFCCGACQLVFRTCHDPSVVHCPICGSGDVRPVAGGE